MARAKADRLLDVDAVERDRWQGSREPVRIGEVCPEGHGPLLAISTIQGVLIRHGGYGAPVRTTELVCPECFWSVVSAVSEVHPREFVA
ncbi:MAG TPA: hypothetical protein VMH24_08445 [Candidatus Sulfotelmatobacter sp.]|nr:hypothetical protein [Candidatus Sulfotelmatobacter sp.]